VPVLAAVLVALVSNVDNLTVGVAFGMRGQRIAGAPNALIAAITMVGTAGAMTSGHVLATALRPSVASALGGTIILAIGVMTAATSVRTVRRPATDAPVAVARTRSRGVLSWRGAVPIGVALSLNNVGAGIGAGIAGVPPLATTLLAGAFSLAFIGGGSRFGWAIGRRFGQRTALLAGVVLVCLGAAMLAGVV
jgi:putative Mn2+ efflux pump MntP